MKKTCLLIWLSIFSMSLCAQAVYETNLYSEKDEFWWGGVVAYGSQMPYVLPLEEFNLALEHKNNQVVPFFLSNKGRYIWSEKPFKFEIKEGCIAVRSEFEKIEVVQAGITLKDAYLNACQKYFKPTGILPDPLFFTKPQYNTWIELIYNQNETDILKYARDILNNNFPEGVLMIDDNWQKYYGNFEFKPDKFSNPKGMVKQLHDMGFKVMLWISPFVTADSPEYRDLAKRGFLIKKKGADTPAIIEWWNGHSACFDLTNPEAAKYFISQLKGMQDEFGIDGFKFDAGDNSFYNRELIDSYKKDALSVDHTMAWAKLGLDFTFNEYRAGWKMGGQALVQRLGDKAYAWDAVQALVPEMIAAGLFGYSYACPDMVGGGSFAYFVDMDQSKIDQNLVVRSAQVHALMPMMQFSVAPWRVLSPENLNIVREAAVLHEKFGSYIINCAKESAITGEPIVRHMEYAFPNEGFAQCRDQFMLGDKYLVVPVVSSSNTRSVKLPKGKWRDDKGKVHKGGKVFELTIPQDRLLYFEKI